MRRRPFLLTGVLALVAITLFWLSFPTYSPYLAAAEAADPGAWSSFVPAVFTAAKPLLWQQVNSSTTAYLEDIDMINANDGWIVGGGSTFLHWDGSTWSPGQSSVQGYFNAVSMVSATDGWAVAAGGKIARWDGSSWKLFATTPTEEWIFDIDMVAADDGWAVGNDGNDGFVLHWNGSQWLFVSTPIDAQFYAVKMISADEGWIAGYNGSYGVILRWDGAKWRRQTVPMTGRLFDIAMTSPNEAWAVGENGVVLDWTNEVWDYWNPTAQNSNDEIIFLMGLDMLSPEAGWMVGGFIDTSFIGKWNGTTWEREQSPVSKYLQAVDMVSEKDGWAVGYDGAILRYAPEP